MNARATAHLNYDQLLRALVDTADLEDKARKHLESCPGCRRQVSQLTQRYGRIGQMAKQLAPAPTRPFRIPAQQPTLRRWQLKPAMAMGMVGALILVFTLWWPQSMDTPPGPDMMATLEEGVDDPVMDEIEALIADALPVAYQEIASATAASESHTVEDLIEWIVPDINEEYDFDTRV